MGVQRRMQRILLVEDDEVMNKGIQCCLNDDMLSVTGAYNRSQAEKMISEQEFDLYILDVNLPDGDGFDLCRTIRKINPDVPVLFLTARGYEVDVVAGFDLGADDYVTKPFNVSILKKRILAILKRYKKISNSLYESKYLRVDQNRRVVYKNSEEVSLTPTEYRILELFIREKGKVITKDSIIEYLYDKDGAFVDEHALSVYISRLRSKIEESDDPFIKTIYGMGYMWIESLQE